MDQNSRQMPAGGGGGGGGGGSFQQRLFLSEFDNLPIFCLLPKHPFTAYADEIVYHDYLDL